MTTHVRFECASSNLRLRTLLRRTQRLLWGCSALGIGAHLALTQIAGTEAQERAAKPLTTEFVKRQPRLTKPLELKKRPAPRRRTVQREMVAVQARRTQAGTSTAFAPTQALAGLARPRADLARGVGAQSALVDPATLAAAVEGEKDVADRVDMSLEMVDVDALDTGKYHALVVQDPQDKRNIRGFFRLRYAYSTTMHKDPWRMVSGVVAVVEAMNLYTQIKTTFEGRITYDRQELLKTPWVFADIHEVNMPVGERTNMGRYLTTGGFWFLDAPEPNPDFTPYPACNILKARQIVEEALQTQGLIRDKDWGFEKLPNSHPIFHCFFDFDGPPPNHYDRIYSNAGKIDGAYLEGKWPAIVSQKAFVHFWNDPANPQLRSERAIQFGVNTIVFALTQEGSITRRVTDEVR